MNRRNIIPFVLTGLAALTLSVAMSPVDRLLLSSRQAEDGIHLDFSKGVGDGCCYVKAPGAPAQRNSFQNLFTFTRNSVGTFLGSNGLIQYANENRWLQSQTFDNASWTKTRTTVSADSIAAPDGTTTADTLNEDGTAASDHSAVQAVAVAGLPMTFSVHVKVANRSWVMLRLGTVDAYFDVANCVAGTVTGTIATTAGSVGNGWCRVSATVIPASTVSTIFIAEANEDITFDGGSQASLYLWGAQAQYGRTAGAYLPTTTAAKYDQPRIEYDSSGNVLGLLVEGTRTTLTLQSENFATTWSNSNTTETADQAVAPDGNTTADTITATADAGYIMQNMQALASNFPRLASVYLKRKTGSGNVTVETGASTSTCTLSNSVWNRCQTMGASIDGTYAVVANVVTVTATAHGLNTGDSVRLDYTSGGAADFSCASVTTLTADTYTCAQTTGDTSGNVTMYPAVMRIKFAANGDEVYAWGGQAETYGTGAFLASSYIPTTTAAITRSNDLATGTLAVNGFTGTGTMLAEVERPEFSTTNYIWQLQDGSSAQISQYMISTTGRITGNSNGYDANAGVNSTVNVFAKGATAFGSTDSASAQAGTVGGTDTAVTLPDALVTYYIGSRSSGGFLNGHIKQLQFWPERKPNAFISRQTQPGPQSSLRWPSYAAAPANDNAPMTIIPRRAA